MVLLQTILILIIVYYGLKFLLKWLAPRLLVYAVKKTNDRFGRQFDARQAHQDTSYHEGETTLHTRPDKKRPSSKNVGEYIDFEEID
ncbi:MAG: DUF4834 family protein [Flavobacteriaceae bacterium]|nr:DUF4834 family protein [Flavobacteriaceae bacterium]